MTIMRTMILGGWVEEEEEGMLRALVVVVWQYSWQ